MAIELGDTQELEIKDGSSYTLEVVYETNTGTELNPIWTPVDITGYTSKFQVRNEYGDPAPAISITEVANADGVITITGAAGKALLTIYPAGVAKLEGRAYYDWFIYSGATVAIPLLGGVIVLKKSAVV